MIPQVVIISNNKSQNLQRLLHVLKICNFDDILQFYNPIDLKKINEKEFNGFFIFCLPYDNLKKWSLYISKKYKNHFKVYFYDSLFEKEMENSVLLKFDFLIVNPNSDSELKMLLLFLKKYYWKKIPQHELINHQKDISILTKRIINTCELLDISDINLYRISEKLLISPNEIKKELKSQLNLSFSEFKKKIENIYKS